MTEHKMKLTAGPFEKIASGKKIIEVRLFDDKRQKIAIGDIIIFSKLPEQKEEVTARVTGLLRYTTFTDLFADFPASYFGHDTKDDLGSKVYQFYTKEQEKEFGVLGIKIELLDKK